MLDDTEEASPSVEIIDNIANSNQDEENFDLLSDNFNPNLLIENFDDYFGSQKLNLLSVEDIIKLKLLPRTNEMCEFCRDTYCEYEGGSVAIKCIFCGVLCNNGTCERKHIDKFCIKRQMYGFESIFD